MKLPAITQTIREVIDGVRALPACAEAAMELAEFARESDQAFRDATEHVLESRLMSVRQFLFNTGHSDATINRVLNGNAIESDYLDKHDDERLKLMAERDLLQRKLDYLLTPHECVVDPCTFNPNARVLYRYRDEPPTDWYGGHVSDLSHEMDWRPVDLEHFEE